MHHLQEDGVTSQDIDKMRDELGRWAGMQNHSLSHERGTKAIALVAALLDNIEQRGERIDRLEKELARAAGIARAHGANAYADDFMRVAQDREDFDAEIAAVKR
jgi:hypothetical protein